MTETHKEAESCAAQNATTHSENTAELSDFKLDKLLILASELRKLVFSEVRPKTMVSA
jgi:hypothetical protein